jgi:hypothetical protein
MAQSEEYKRGYQDGRRGREYSMVRSDDYICGYIDGEAAREHDELVYAEAFEDA